MGRGPPPDARLRAVGLEYQTLPRRRSRHVTQAAPCTGSADPILCGRGASTRPQRYMASARERHVTRDPSPARPLPCTVPIHPILPSRQSLPSARRAHLHPSHHLSSRPSGTIPSSRHSSQPGHNSVCVALEGAAVAVQTHALHLSHARNLPESLLGELRAPAPHLSSEPMLLTDGHHSLPVPPPHVPAAQELPEGRARSAPDLAGGS